MTVPYTSFITVWKAGQRDRYGEVEYQPPTVFKANFRNGGKLKLTDDKGQEFSPVSTYWTRLEVVFGESFTPSNGNLIAKGDYRDILDPSEVSTQQIRGRTIEDNSMFCQVSDYTFGTM